jgi:hypothetical protein
MIAAIKAASERGSTRERGCPKGASRAPGPSDLDVVVTVWVAFAFAVAQPLFDMLGRGADFFVAHRTSPLEIVLLAVVLAIVLPLGCGAVLVVVGRLAPRLGLALHAAVFGGLIALFVLQVLTRVAALASLPGLVLVAVALVGGAAAVAALHRAKAARTFFRVVSPAPVLFAVLFLLASPVRMLIPPASSPSDRAASGIDNPVPIVMVVFDEMPVTSLMDERGQVDRTLYPSFARLAREGTWFRNATTSHSLSQEAVPAMLSGLYPKRGTGVPTLASHPDNLFTLLGRHYDVRAFETYTELCPPAYCRTRAQPDRSFVARWGSLASDLRIAALHAFLPRDLARGLPPVDETPRRLPGRRCA